MARKEECAKCGHKKEHTDWSYCDRCRKKYRRSHYKSNTSYYVNRALVWNRQARKRLRTFIDGEKSKPCMDCETSYPSYVMTFDHRPGTRKYFNIADAIKRPMKLETVKKEIKKCDVVCANCHCIRTHSRKCGHG